LCFNAILKNNFFRFFRTPTFTFRDFGLAAPRLDAAVNPMGKPITSLFPVHDLSSMILD